MSRFYIPGYREAVKCESDVRDAAFLDLTTDICGIPIRQMTPRDFLILDGIGSTVLERIPTREDIIKFLWLLSPGYGSSKLRAWLFVRRCRNLPWVLAIEQIWKYLEDTFQDSPGGSSSTAAYAGWCAHLIDAISSNYGWTREHVLNCNLKILYQLVKCIKKRMDPDAIVFNRSDRIVGQHLALMQQRINLLKTLRKRANN